MKIFIFQDWKEVRAPCISQEECGVQYSHNLLGALAKQGASNSLILSGDQDQQQGKTQLFVAIESYTFGISIIFSGSLGFLDPVGIFWNLMQSLGIFGNLWKCFGMKWNLLESFGIFWNLLESLKIFGNQSTLEFLRESQLFFLIYLSTLGAFKLREIVIILTKSLHFTASHFYKIHQIECEK